MRGFRATQSRLSAELSVLSKSSFCSPTQFLTRKCMSTTSSFLRTSRPNLGVVTFKLADIGEGIAEVELLRWHIKEGDNLEEMDSVCEVQSDKSAVEISSPFSGKILKFHHGVGEMIKIGAPLMDIEVAGEGSAAVESKESAPAAAASTPTPSSESKPKAETSSSNGNVLASPACRSLAKEHGINLADVPATGPKGQVTKEDLLNFKKSGSSSSSSSTTTGSKPSTPAARPAGGESKEEVLLSSGIAKGMIKSMNASLSIPTMSIQEDIDISTLNAMRVQMKEFVTSKDKDAKLTVTPLIVKAVSVALKHVPILNSKFDVQKQDRYDVYHNHNISVAIDTPIGLLVPNIKNVEGLSLLEIQERLGELQSLAKAGKLSLPHLTGGTISISNVGVIGGTAVRPILFDGQATILGLGRVQKLPRYNEQTKSFEPRDIMNITATVDHRHVDGATVARFMKVLREVLENPSLMML